MLKEEFDAAIVASRILGLPGEPFQFEGRSAFVSANIGIAMNSTGVTAEERFRAADTAMYRARANGKVRSEFFNVGIRAGRYMIRDGDRLAQCA